MQLRVKEASDEEFLSLGKEVRRITSAYGSLLILDDRVHSVEELGADGVHLGEKDMPVIQARELLGEGAIIGGTADRSGRVEELYKEGADYIGCGPFRYTSTKKELSPVLGIEGYRSILARMEDLGIELPLLAIGGIRRGDIAALLGEGVHGVAVSSAVAAAEDPVEEMRAFLKATSERSGADNG